MAFDPTHQGFIELDFTFPGGVAVYELDLVGIDQGAHDTLRLNCYLSQDGDFVTVWHGLLDAYMTEISLGFDHDPTFDLTEQYEEPLFRGCIEDDETGVVILKGDCRHRQLVCRAVRGYVSRMNIPSAMPRLKGYRFPREVIAYAAWAYHRFALSAADVEDLLAERGVTVSRETIRRWVNRFGVHFADCVKRDRPTAVDKWHLDEVVIPINGRKYWLWRAVDARGDVLDILVQPQRNAKAARRFLAKLIDRFGVPVLSR